MKISEILKNWYRGNGRDLPWRESKNPYSVWVSEIILQQTRVAQGEAYYRKFMKRFPDIQSLARADISEVLNLWQGLGYYSRARNMHAAAKYICSERDGEFPDTFKELLQLQGVGRYTAGAIASIAFREPAPAVDGNVKRIFSRLFAIEGDLSRMSNQKYIEELVKEHIDKERPDIFNQALMDFGSAVCRPKNPECKACPFAFRCVAFRQDRVNELPETRKKAAQRQRFFYYMVLHHEGHFYLEQRKNNDIWKLLYQFPLVESVKKLSEEEILLNIKERLSPLKNGFRFESITEEYKHVLSHQNIHARFVIIRTGSDLPEENFPQLKKVPFSSRDKFAVPRLIDRFMNNFVSLHFK